MIDWAADEGSLFAVVIVIGFCTFLLRATLVFWLPKIGELTKTALSSVSSSLLVGLSVPFFFFVEGSFLPFRLEVLALVATIPLIWLSKKPGLSLPIAIVLLGSMYLFFSILGVN